MNENEKISLGGANGGANGGNNNMGSDGEFAVPTENVSLPSLGVFYPNKNKLVTIRYMTAESDNTLFSTDLVRSGKVLDVILDESVLDKDIRPVDMISGDRNLLLIEIRKTGFGNEYFPDEKKHCSACGEDYKPMVDLDKLKPKVLEIGAGNFTECNSRYLAENRNASVVAIDYRSDLQKEMKKLSLMWKTHLFPVCDFITPSNIEQHLKFARKNMDGIDILSIDLDGNDFWVLNSIDFTGISVVVAEYNSLFGNEEAVSVPRDDNFDRKTKHFSCLYYGASLPAFINVLSRSGFTFLGSNRACNNAFFVKSDYLGRFSLEIPSSLDKFTDTRVRESRNQFGSLDHLSGESRARIIKDLPLVNVETNKSCKVGDLWNFE